MNSFLQSGAGSPLPAEAGTAPPRGMRFRTIAARLRQAISDGRWPVGGRLPTESELARTHAVGLNTVRRAVDLLIEEGLVRRRQGSGTYVVAAPAAAGPPRFVGVLVPSTTLYYPKLIQGIERVTSSAGVKLVLACSEYDPAREAAQLGQLLDAGAAGLILVPNLHLVADPQAHLARLHELPVPFVLAERRPPVARPAEATSYVVSDAFGGAYAAVRHLVGLGRRRIGYLGRSATATAAEVFAGFQQAVADFGLVPPAETVARQPEWAGDDLARYAARGAAAGVDAVLCLGDREGTALLPHLRRAGRTIPDEVAVVVYDDEVADLAEVPLTAVAPHKTEVGRLAAELLLRRIAMGPSAPATQIVCQPRLAIRSSCGAMATGTHQPDPPPPPNQPNPPNPPNQPSPTAATATAAR
ncbi:MAG: GntR family transcriptional regulator [Micromonosporaceae bacterium]|nr:GntR family transcriptional regulator [Micromonosporaceae bacterium]